MRNNTNDLVATFVPVTDGRYDRQSLWAHPLRYIIPNAAAAVLWFILAQHLQGISHSAIIGVMALHLSMAIAGLWAIVLPLFGLDYSHFL